MKVVASVLLASLLLLTAPGPQRALAQPDAGLTEILFGTLGATAATWPLFLAEQEGYFRDEGLKITQVVTSNPVNTANQVASGGLNIASDGTDTIIAAVSHKLAVKAVSTFMIPNPYTLVTLPSIKSWEDLKGKTVSMGTKQDVTAIVFDAMAKAHRLDMNKDFDLNIIGNTGQRFQALQSGNIQAALLGQPFDFRAEAAGMHVFDRATNYYKDWMYTVVVVNTSWAASHRPLVVKFIRALRKGAIYGYEHPQEAIGILMTATKTDAASAQKAYDLDFKQLKAFSRTGIVPAKNVQAVMNAMLAIGSIPAAPPVSEVVDNTFAQEAQR